MEYTVVGAYKVDFNADIVPGKSMAGFTILNQDYDDVRRALEILDKKYYFQDNGDYLEVFSKVDQEYGNIDIIMNFFSTLKRSSIASMYLKQMMIISIKVEYLESMVLEIKLSILPNSVNLKELQRARVSY